MEEYKKLLVPIDGSELSVKALKKAFSLARAFGSEITVLHVEGVPQGNWGMPGLEGSQPTEFEYQSLMKDESERILYDARLLSKKNNNDVVTILLRGHAANEIINSSKHYDMIVMGTHGRGGLKHLLIGSVAEKVSRHACCPVMLIREKPCE